MSGVLEWIYLFWGKFYSEYMEAEWQTRNSD